MASREYPPPLRSPEENEGTHPLAEYSEENPGSTSATPERPGNENMMEEPSSAEEQEPGMGSGA